jgi:hypothetical protein
VPELGVMLPFAPGQITSGDFLGEWVSVVEECGDEDLLRFRSAVVDRL